MNISHIMAVFKAEYYTTTSKFRDIRQYIPLIFIGGIIFFSYILRVIYEFVREGITIENPPMPTFFSIIVVFSYFILFTPLLSPLGRMVYDGGANSRREVAINAPVNSRDLLYGNLLSNLAFFLPFFGFIGTLSLTPFIGTGLYSPLITSLLLFFVLSLLILVGLIGGTLISPIIFTFISQRKNSQIRALVSFSVSAMLIISLPIFRYFLENTTLNGSMGWITFLPFTLAGIIIVYILYGVSIGLTIFQAWIGLILYIIVLTILGYFSAETIYNLDNHQHKIASSNPDGKPEWLLNNLTKAVPLSYRNVVKSMMKASLRDIEHLARITIGLTITVFMIFALSSKGLFRENAEFIPEIELSVIVFALVISSASVIMIEAAAFTIQHKDMFALIKSAPNGARKLIVGKATQMVILLSPIFISMIISLSILDFISPTNVIPLSIITVLILISMTTLSLAITLINPSDNEEDIGNFLNLILFYLISFVIAVIPVYIIIAEIQLQTYQFLLTVVIVLAVSALFITTAIIALDRMNLETLDSPFSTSIVGGVKTFVLFLLGWNVLPLISISYFVVTQDIVGFIIFNYLIILVFSFAYFGFNKMKFVTGRLNLKNLIIAFKFLLVMLGIGFSMAIISIFLPQNQLQNQFVLFFNLDNILFFLLIIAILSLIEELFFRGVLLHYARKSMSDNWAMIISSVIFGFIHIYPIISMINATIQGMILAKLKFETKSIVYPSIVHISYNIILVLILIY